MTLIILLWPNSESPHNGTLLFLILIFATITSLAAHYSHLLQGCMVAIAGGSWRLIACEEDGAKLWWRVERQLWIEAVGDAWRRRSGEIQRLGGKFWSGRFFRIGRRELQRSEWGELVVKEDEGRLCQRIPEMCR